MNDPVFVRGLFDEMAKTYGVVNMITSFGFACRWRNQCVRAIDLKPGSKVLDLMTGMGELCPDLATIVGRSGGVIALDISPVMCAKAEKQAKRLGSVAPIEIIEGDVLSCSIPDGSVDFVFSSFGLKTFNSEQLSILAEQIKRVLRPGGSYSLIEISVPPARGLRVPYMFYLNFLIPFLGWILMGNPDNYRLLGTYTQAFGNCRRFGNMLSNAGLEVQYRDYFFGCASAVVGSKPFPEKTTS